MIRKLATEILPIALATLVGVLILTHPAGVDFRPGAPLDLIAILTALITYGVTNAIAEHLNQTTD